MGAEGYASILPGIARRDDEGGTLRDAQRRGWGGIGTRVRPLWVGLGLWVASLGWIAPAAGEDTRWGVGTEIGFLSGTYDGTVFGLSAQLDYYLDQAFSVGGLMQLVPGDDLTQIGFAATARYHIRLGAFNIVPFAGAGLIHADLDRGSGPGRVDSNDTSYYLPLGLSFEYQLAKKLALATTLTVNLYDLDLDPPAGNDRTSVALLFGFHFGP